jgi:hypothetical protein
MGFASGINWFSTTLVVGIGLYPIAVIICSILAWVYRRHRLHTAIIVNLVPMLWVLLVGGRVVLINL